MTNICDLPTSASKCFICELNGQYVTSVTEISKLMAGMWYVWYAHRYRLPMIKSLKNLIQLLDGWMSSYTMSCTEYLNIQANIYPEFVTFKQWPTLYFHCILLY